METIECSTCGWQGTDDELLEEVTNGTCYSYVCPECESDDLVELDDED